MSEIDPRKNAWLEHKATRECLDGLGAVPPCELDFQWGWNAHASHTAALRDLTQSSEIKADEQESRLCLLLADIRSALGDPEGKMMQEDFVQHCKEVVEWLNKLDFADWKGGAIKNRGEYGFALYDLGGCIVEHYKTPLEALTAYLKGKGERDGDRS